MGRQSSAETQFRKRVRQERERRQWSQAELSKRLQAKGLEHLIPSAVAKIESGDRAVRIGEAHALADLFEAPVDALLGRSVERGSELAYTLRAAQNTARQAAQQAGAVADALGDSLVDLRAFDGVGELESQVGRAQRALREAQDACTLAAKFTLPPPSRVGLRADLAIPETRTLVVGPKETR